jgi:signal recognition particle receptor subunit beta
VQHASGTGARPGFFKEWFKMAVYNYAGGEVNIKIVYYGPGLSGKTTNLEYMYSKLPRENKGKMVSMKTKTDRTLFFDFLPIEVGELAGLKVRFLLYTVPGQVYYNATRKLVLKGVDALVFVADSSPGSLDEDRESLDNLEENLNEIGISLSSTPWVLQYNKRDVPGCMKKKLLDKDLNTWNAPSFEAVATEGKGVYETFEGIAKLVFKMLRHELNDNKAGKNGSVNSEPGGGQVDAEVVAQGALKGIGSEAGESETSGYAEEREEEHESVSEFVDHVLTEDAVPAGSATDLGMEREGYEEYGHMVELGDNGNGSAAEKAEKKPEGKAKVAVPEKEEVESEASVAVAEKEEVEVEAKVAVAEKEEFINDPLVKFGEEKPETAVDAEPGSAEDAEERPAKMVTVPIELTEEEIRNEVPVKVILDIKVHSG